MEYVKLNEVFEFIRNGASIKQFDTKEGYPITRIETIANGYVDLNKMGYANIMDLNKYEDYLLQNGDILMSHINSEKHLGKVAIYENINKSIIHGMNLLCLRPNKEIIYPKYVYYYFNNDDFKRQLPKITKKSVNQASFSVNDLKNLKIKITDLDTQIKIVNVLNKSQELIIKKRKQVQELDKLVKSRFVEMFGNPVTNPKGWKFDKLENITYKITDGKHGDCQNEENSGYYFISAKDINNRKIYTDNARQITKSDFEETNKRTMLQVDDIVIVNTGATIGKTAIVKQEDVSKNLTFQKSVAIVTVNKNLLISDFLEQHIIFDRERIYANASGSAQKNWLLSQMRSYKVIIPPLELQNQFADFVKQVDKLKFEMEKSLKELEDNFNSLMKKAFKGELFE